MDEQTNERTNNAVSRVAFATENVTLSGKSGKKGLKIAFFHIFNMENGKNIFFAPDISKGLGKTFQMTYWKVL